MGPYICWFIRLPTFSSCPWHLDVKETLNYCYLGWVEYMTVSGYTLENILLGDDKDKGL